MTTQLKKTGYDREKLTAGILHIGVGNFHRAHEEYYTDLLIGKNNLQLFQQDTSPHIADSHDLDRGYTCGDGHDSRQSVDTGIGRAASFHNVGLHIHTGGCRTRAPHITGFGRVHDRRVRRSRIPSGSGNPRRQPRQLAMDMEHSAHMRAFHALLCVERMQGDRQGGS